jgi:hypothetical protein
MKYLHTFIENNQMGLVEFCGWGKMIQSKKSSDSVPLIAQKKR